jgi:hypothetical protein
LLTLVFLLLWVVIYRAALAAHLRVSLVLDCVSMDNEPAWSQLLAAVVGATCDAAGTPCCDHVTPEAMELLSTARLPPPGAAADDDDDVAVVAAAADAAAPDVQLQPEPEPEAVVELEAVVVVGTPPPPPAPASAAPPPPPHRVAFVCSDCITSAAGPELLSIAPAIDLFTFNYVLVENAVALRQDEFRALRAVFSAAKVGSVFVFMDASYHLWAEVVEAFSSLQLPTTTTAPAAAAPAAAPAPAAAAAAPATGGGDEENEQREEAEQQEQRFAVLHPHPQPWQCTSTMLVVKLQPS